MRSIRANKLTESVSCVNSIEHGKAKQFRNGITEYLKKRGLRPVTFNGADKPGVIEARMAAAERAKNFR